MEPDWKRTYQVPIKAFPSTCRSTRLNPSGSTVVFRSFVFLRIRGGSSQLALKLPPKKLARPPTEPACRSYTCNNVCPWIRTLGRSRKIEKMALEVPGSSIVTLNGIFVTWQNEGVKQGFAT
jgi:hypothetical protein